MLYINIIHSIIRNENFLDPITTQFERAKTSDSLFTANFPGNNSTCGVFTYCIYVSSGHLDPTQRVRHNNHLRLIKEHCSTHAIRRSPVALLTFMKLVI